MKDWKDDIDKKYGITSSVDPDYRFLKAERIGTLIADIEDLLKKQRDNCAKYFDEQTEGMETEDIAWEIEKRILISNAPEPGGSGSDEEIITLIKGDGTLKMKTKHCTDCGCELGEGEGQVFTCCEICWVKKYPKEAQNETENL